MNSRLLAAAGSAALFVSTTTLLRAEGPPASQPAVLEPVAYVKLKAALPKTFGDLEQTSATGQKTAMGAMKLSVTDADYGTEADGVPSAHITFTDYGGMPGTLDAMAVWTKIPIDNDSDAESVKTTKFGDYPALETFRKESKEGEIAVVVGKRFMAMIKTRNLPVEKVREIVGKVDFKALENAEK